MKVRISGNSIRFRLKQSEVKKFWEAKAITEITSFGPADTDALRFILQQGSSAEFNISFQKNTVTLSVPPSVCHRWTGTDLVGFEEIIDTDKGKTMKILVEKDFACLDGSLLDNEDTYPNPKATC